MTKTVGIGVVGLGHWGPNHVRIFSQCAGARVVVAADLSAERRRYVGRLYRDVELVADARELLAIATACDRVLVHGHVFVYNAGIRYLHHGLAKGSLGGVQYVHATRTNLGPIRRDVNVVDDLATHELTIFDYLFGRAPTGCRRRAVACSVRATRTSRL